MSKTTEKTNGKAALAAKTQIQVIKEEVVDSVTKRVQSFIQQGRLHLPKGYSAANAMHAAWLILQETKTKDGKLALEHCTRASIANALFRMVVLALDPMKQQCYFLAYGTHLSCQPSYFGTIAQAQRMAGVSEVLPMVVYEGEKFELAIERGRYVVEYHKPSTTTTAETPITHAYCVVEYADGRPPTTEVMRWDQIQTSWKKSPSNTNREGAPHKDQPDQMAIRTVVNRALKRPIKSSTDAHLAEVLEELERADAVAAADSEIEAEVREHGNREVLTLEEDRTIDVDADSGDDEATEATEAEGDLFATAPF